MILPGSQPQAIFGSKVPGMGGQKVATWYTHRVDSNVQRIVGFNPHNAFVGVTDEQGNSSHLNGHSIPTQNGSQINPVFSSKAFDKLIQMPVGGSYGIGITEVLHNGSRELVSTIFKRAQLELLAANNQCRDATIDGVNGKICEIRRIKGDSQAKNAGDVMFSVEMRAKLATAHALFKVGKSWHPLGQRISLAEFSNAQSIELFFVPPTTMTARHMMSDLVSLQFSSMSRMAKGDRFYINPKRLNISETDSQVLSRLSLITVDDEVSRQQSIFTLEGTSHQNITQVAGSDGVWYLQARGVQSLFPLERIERIEPVSWFSGPPSKTVSDAAGINPVLTNTALQAITYAPLGGQYLVSAEGVRLDGSKVTFHTNLNKQAELRLLPAPDQQCVAFTLNGVPGMRCSLREMKGTALDAVNKNLRITLRASQPLMGGQYFAGNGWHLFGNEIPLTMLAENQRLEVFYVPPASLQRDSKNTLNVQPQFELVLHDADRQNGLSKINLGTINFDAIESTPELLINNRINNEVFIYSVNKVASDITPLEGEVKPVDSYNKIDADAIKSSQVIPLVKSGASIIFDSANSVKGKMVTVDNMRGIAYPLYKLTVDGDLPKTLSLQLRSSNLTSGVRYSYDNLHWYKIDTPIQLNKLQGENEIFIFYNENISNPKWNTNLIANDKREVIYSFSKAGETSNQVGFYIKAISVPFSSHKKYGDVVAGFMDVGSDKYIDSFNYQAMVSIIDNPKEPDNGAQKHMVPYADIHFSPEGLYPDIKQQPFNKPFDLPIGSMGFSVSFYTNPNVPTLKYGIATLDIVKDRINLSHHERGMRIQGFQQSQTGQSSVQQSIYNVKFLNGMFAGPGDTVKFQFNLPDKISMDYSNNYPVTLRCLSETARKLGLRYSMRMLQPAPVDNNSISNGVIDGTNYPLGNIYGDYSKYFKNQPVLVSLTLPENYSESYLDLGCSVDGYFYRGRLDAYGLNISKLGEIDSKLVYESPLSIKPQSTYNSDINITPAVNFSHSAILSALSDDSGWINRLTFHTPNDNYELTTENSVLVPLPNGLEKMGLTVTTRDINSIKDLYHNKPVGIDFTMLNPHGNAKHHLLMNVITMDSDMKLSLSAPASVVADEDFNIAGAFTHPVTTHTLWLNLNIDDANGNLLSAGKLIFNDSSATTIDLSIGKNKAINIPIGVTGFKIVGKIKNPAPLGGITYNVSFAEGAIDTGEHEVVVDVINNKVVNVENSTVIEGMPLHSLIKLKAALINNGPYLTVGLDHTDFTNNIDYSQAKVIFKDTSQQDICMQEHVDLSTGRLEIKLPLNTQFIEIELPTLEDQINEATEVIQISAALDNQQPVYGTLTIINKEVDPTVKLSVNAIDETTQQGDFAPSSPDVVFNYKIVEEYSNMVPPDAKSLLLATSQQRAKYLINRAKDVLAVRAIVTGTSLATNIGRRYCAFNIENSEEHAPVPSWFEYESGESGTWSKIYNDCGSTPVIIDDGYWRQTSSNPAKGTKTMELNSRLRFVMQDGVSGWTTETGRFWAGSAAGNGKVTFELLFSQ
ncbi:hypothetical protein [Aeromonas veronii]|uniref:hypothetical protein n=1 Tax=Aeromonas veronii TaxID=654 RepID=UPI0035B6EBC5